MSNQPDNRYKSATKNSERAIMTYNLKLITQDLKPKTQNTELTKHDPIRAF